jgi:hypothetical protein
MSSDFSGPPGEPPGLSITSALEMLPRLCANLVGVIAVVAGLWLAIELFGSIFRTLSSPANARPLLTEWAETLGGDKLTVKVADQNYPLASLAATVVLGVGCCVLTWLALGIMLTGAKVISILNSDREAIRRILQHALGPARVK